MIRRVERYAGARLAVVLIAGALVIASEVPQIAVAIAVLAGGLLGRQLHARRVHAAIAPAQPAPTRTALRSDVGIRRAALAALLLVGAVAVLLVPATFDGSDDEQEVVRAPKAPPPGRAVAPAPVRRPLERPFAIAGARFTIFLPRAGAWVSEIVRRSPGRGRRWVVVGVRTRNLERTRFDPNRLSYRLRDGAGGWYYPQVAGGTGPPSLSTRGQLRRGQTAETRLAFRVPSRSRQLTLVFEPRLVANRRVEVALPAV